MKGKRRESFIAAVDQSYTDFTTNYNYDKLNKFYPITFSKMVNTVASNFLDDPKDRKYYADSYTCCPPPLFIIIITITEVNKAINASLVFLIRYNLLVLARFFHLLLDF